MSNVHRGCIFITKASSSLYTEGISGICTVRIKVFSGVGNVLLSAETMNVHVSPSGLTPIPITSVRGSDPKDGQNVCITVLRCFNHPLAELGGEHCVFIEEEGGVTIENLTVHSARAGNNSEVNFNSIYLCGDTRNSNYDVHIEIEEQD